jgi:hypothetical protein
LRTGSRPLRTVISLEPYSPFVADLFAFLDVCEAGFFASAFFFSDAAP